jgi:hypothetical protein
MDRTNFTKLRLSPLIVGYLIAALYISDFWNFVNGKIRSGDLYLPESGPISKTWATELLGPMNVSSIAIVLIERMALIGSELFTF